MKTNKSLFFVVLGGALVFSSSVFANNLPKENIRVSAKVIGGCKVQANDVDFGKLTDEKMGTPQFEDVTIQCSKNMSFKFYLSSKNNPQGHHGTYLMHEDETGTVPQNTNLKDEGRYIYYDISTGNLSSNSEYSIIQASGNGWLPGHPDDRYKSQFTIKTDQEVVLPIRYIVGRPNEKVISRLAGIYKDQITYILEY